MKNLVTEKQVDLIRARHHLFEFGEDCVEVIKKMEEQGVEGFNLAYNFLITSALESLGKSYMCLRWEKEDRLGIDDIKKEHQVMVMI